jgi:NaMN:DMB phosphoribosyltransferase
MIASPAGQGYPKLESAPRRFQGIHAMHTGLPFDDIRALFLQLPEPDRNAAAAATAREQELIKPRGALGRLEVISAHIAAWQGKARPVVNRPLVAIFAGSHGVAAKGVSAYPSEVNAAMLASFSAGQAAINQICKTFDLGLKVFDLAIAMPTADITEAAALEEAACAATIGFGMEAIANGTDLLCLGEMGIGNTTPAAAIYAALYGGAAAELGGTRRPASTMPAMRGRWRRSSRRSRSIATTSRTRSKFCAASAAGRSRRWPVRFSPRGWSVSR